MPGRGGHDGRYGVDRGHRRHDVSEHHELVHRLGLEVGRREEADVCRHRRAPVDLDHPTVLVDLPVGVERLALAPPDVELDDDLVADGVPSSWPPLRRHIPPRWSTTRGRDPRWSARTRPRSERRRARPRARRRPSAPPRRRPPCPERSSPEARDGRSVCRSPPGSRSRASRRTSYRQPR